jgi:hypothetical protein
MNSSAVVITPPDDLALDGTRILLVDLDSVQTQLISDALKNIDYTGRVILYFWKSVDDIDWMIDKKHKSSTIFFNADSTNDLIVGYLSAQPNSHYFGTLRSLSTLVGPAINSFEQCMDILTRSIGDYETK